MERILFWSIGIFILVLLAFVPLTFQIRFRIAECFSFSLSGVSGPKCYLSLGIFIGRQGALCPAQGLIG